MNCFRFLFVLALSTSLVLAEDAPKDSPNPTGDTHVPQATDGSATSPASPGADPSTLGNPGGLPGPMSPGGMPQGMTGVPSPRGSSGPRSEMELSGSNDLVKCPIIDRSAQVRRDLAPTADAIRAELARAVEAARGSRNPQCQTVGTSLNGLVVGFRSPGPGAQSTCESSPATCAAMLDQILPQIDACTENREGLADMATSVALNLTAGSPLGLVSLGVSAFRSFINLFNGRAERRETDRQNRQIAQQRRDVVEAAASCAMMTFYEVSICTPSNAGTISDILDRATPIPVCTNRSSLGTMNQTQIVTSINTLKSCLNNDPTKITQCGGAISGAANANAGEKAACLVEEGTALGANTRGFRERDIPDFLKMARRHHTRQIISLKNRLAQSESSDLSGGPDRAALILHCFYGKMARSISTQNPERPVAAGELAAQDQADVNRGGVLRDTPENERVLLAANADSVESICNTIDNCISNAPAATTIADTFGPQAATLSQKMCNGVQKFLDYGTNTLNGRLTSMERAVGRGGTYGQNCVAAAPTVRPASGTETTNQ